MASYDRLDSTPSLSVAHVDSAAEKAALRKVGA